MCNIHLKLQESEKTAVRRVCCSGSNEPSYDLLQQDQSMSLFGQAAKNCVKHQSINNGLCRMEPEFTQLKWPLMSFTDISHRLPQRHQCGHFWSPHSPEFFLWGFLKQKLSVRKPGTLVKRWASSFLPYRKFCVARLSQTRAEHSFPVFSTGVGMQYVKVFYKLYKSKGRPRKGCEDPEREQRYSSTLSLIPALEGVGGQATHRSLYPREMNPVPTVQGTKWAPELIRFDDSLQAGRSGNRIPVEARFPTHVQTSYRAHPAPYKTDTGSLSWGKTGPGVTLTTHPHLAPRLQKEQSYTSTPPLGLHVLFQGEIHLYIYMLFIHLYV